MRAALDTVEPERADTYYRFSVKCDRPTNARIEAAARKAGVSATTFVQRHFETIFNVPAGKPKAQAEFNPVTFAKANGVTVTSARLWRWLSDEANDAGIVTVKLIAMSRALDSLVNESYAAKYRNELIAAGLVEAVSDGYGRNGITYRVWGRRDG